MIYVKESNLSSSRLTKSPEDVCIRKWTELLRNAPSEDYSYLFQTDSLVPIADKTLEPWSQGIYITSGGHDAALIAVDHYLNLYIAFKNNGNWRLKVIS